MHLCLANCICGDNDLCVSQTAVATHSIDLSQSGFLLKTGSNQRAGMLYISLLLQFFFWIFAVLLLLLWFI